MKRAFTFFILCCFAVPLHAQTGNLLFKHLTRASGLPVDEVTCLAQDSTGFIWIGSKEGLFRFDGFSYKTFSHDPGNLQTIPANYISKLHVDKEGYLWIGTSGGAAVMKNNGQLLKIFNSETESSFTKESDGVFDIQTDKNVVWISTGDGLFSISKKGSQITGIQKHDFKKKFHYSTNKNGAFIVDSKGKLWICTLHGLVIYDPLKTELLHAGNNPSSLRILEEKNAFRSLSIDETGKSIRYSTWEPAVRIYSMDENKVLTLYSGKSSENPEYENLISQFLKDDHGLLWMATGKGIKTIDNKNLERITPHHPGNLHSINSNYVTSLLQDREGSIWAGTGEGISITQPYKQSFINLSSNSVEVHRFAKMPVNTIIPVSPNTFLIGGYGVYRTDPFFNVQEHYLFGTSKYDWIWKYYMQGNNIYISAQEGNLLYNSKTQKLDKLTEPPFDKFYPISSFVSGKDGFIWMSNYHNRFLKYNPQSKQYKIYNLPELGEEPSIILVEKDNEDNLWILSSTTGLLKFDGVEEKITERLLVNKNNGLQATQILFSKDVGEELLIGYVSKGISLYHKKNKSFRHFSRTDGLISNSVTDALQTDKHTIWITTRNGISCFDLQTTTFKNYSYDDGIVQNDFECITQLPDGRLAAGSKKGLVHFFPEKINAQQKLSSPIITGINVYGRDLPVDSFSDLPLRISYNENYFSFEYISLQYLNNQQIEYAYMLEGFDKDWIHAGNRRFASYSNVTGGNYKLRVKARLPGGQWIENKSLLAVEVGTAFYKTIWFYIISVVLLTGILYAIFRYRLNQLIRLEKMRTSISRDLHDEVGATLSSISIFSEMAKQSVPADSTAEKYLHRIGERSRDSIEKMGDIVWSINPDNDSLQQILIKMKGFVNDLFENKDCEIHWQQENLHNLTLDMQQRKNFYLFFKEAVNNAAKYSCAKNIYIELTAEKKQVKLLVKDDGKGFEPGSAQMGNGIKNMHHRATALHGKVVIHSHPGKGSEISLQFLV